MIAGIVISSVSCDQATKRAAAAALEGRASVSLLGDSIRLCYESNTGGFLSLGAGLSQQLRVWVFLLFPAIVIPGILFYVLRRRSADRLEVVALSLLAAGGLGNLIDRVWYGAVRDFLNVGIGPLRTGIFNVADVFITVAALLLFIRCCGVRFYKVT